MLELYTSARRESILLACSFEFDSNLEVSPDRARNEGVDSTLSYVCYLHHVDLCISLSDSITPFDAWK